MPRWSKIASLLLLAAWLPATLHCRIETSGLLEPADSCCAGPAETASDCKDDACPTVEETLIKESGDDLIAAPVCCTCPLCGGALVCADDGCTEPAHTPVRHPPPDLTAGWQFVFRAAPPARAPSLNT